ncbi:PREDICTED: nuclear transition protein 2 [Condylura cristata]|uniref:nuclear transition protein 2 n=1 Tax=Condylura cristata TaxID=143302 RepID=UPI00033465C8|nr:PREDICTED: nuclear transition protein 2 [Condylura cristata]
MDTKTQNLPITHTQPHSNARPQGHPCSQCHCSHHCQNCSQSCSRSSSQSPAGHGSPAASSSQTPSPSPPPRNHKHAMHAHHCRLRPTTHASSCPKRRKPLEGKVTRRRVVKKGQRGHRTKRRSAGTIARNALPAGGRATGPQMGRAAGQTWAQCRQMQRARQPGGRGDSHQAVGWVVGWTDGRMVRWLWQQETRRVNGWTHEDLDHSLGYAHAPIGQLSSPHCTPKS